MAFMKYANAQVIRPQVSKTQWQNIRTAGKKKADETQGKLSENLVERASEIFGDNFNPNQYLLTHATIIASVDTYSPAGIKTGSVMEDGFKVNRKYSNFRIKPETDIYINHNFDAWDRRVLLASYPTFIGGHNFCEHVQLEELSKGRIIDAVARDIGDAIYVDILIATDRKHKDLVADIEAGRMGTLSMGCTIDGSICTKCGNWAADETEMCSHIKYAKGNTFFDENGKQCRIAELCGHPSLGPTGGVQFIEASWVGTPAFPGAVLRNVLDFTEETAKKAKKILSSPPPEWSKKDVLKAASLTVEASEKVAATVRYAQAPTTAGSVLAVRDDFLAGWEDEDGGGDSEAPAAPTPAPAAPAKAAPFKDVEDDVYNHLLTRVRDRLQKDLQPEDSSPGNSSTNETLNKQSAFARKAYRAGLDEIVRTASSDADLINRVAGFNQQVGIVVPVEIYRTSVKLGNLNQYDSTDSYFRACRLALGREPSKGEVKTLVRLGKLLSQGLSLGGYGHIRQSPPRGE